jgi:hypothetical protein
MSIGWDETRVHVNMYERQSQWIMKTDRPALASERAPQGGQTVELNTQTNIWLFAPGGALQQDGMAGRQA